MKSLEISLLNLAKDWDISPLYAGENCGILASVVLSQYTRVTDRRQINRQTTYDGNSRTVQCNCNVRLKRSAIFNILRLPTWTADTFLSVDVSSNYLRLFSVVFCKFLANIDNTWRNTLSYWLHVVLVGRFRDKRLRITEQHQDLV